MPLSLILVRHGETDWNREERIQGSSDVPLNAIGRWQAYRVGFHLRHLRAQAIYTSDLTRAKQTAQAIAEITGLPVHEDARLRERTMGDYEGQVFKDVAARLGVSIGRGWTELGDLLPGAESLAQVRVRMQEALDEIATHCNNQRVIVVTHGAAIMSLWPAGQRQGVPNGTIVELQWPHAKIELPTTLRLQTAR